MGSMALAKGKRVGVLLCGGRDVSCVRTGVDTLPSYR